MTWAWTPLDRPDPLLRDPQEMRPVSHMPESHEPSAATEFSPVFHCNDDCVLVRKVPRAHKEGLKETEGVKDASVLGILSIESREERAIQCVGQYRPAVWVHVHLAKSCSYRTHDAVRAHAFGGVRSQETLPGRQHKWSEIATRW